MSLSAIKLQFSLEYVLYLYSQDIAQRLVHSKNLINGRNGKKGGRDERTEHKKKCKGWLQVTGRGKNSG